MNTDKIVTNSASITNARLLEMLFFLFILYILEDKWDTPELKTLAINFFSIILEAFPFMLLGALVGGIIEGFLSRNILVKFFNRRGNFVPIFIGAMIGVVFPVCECAIVVVIRRLLKKGTPIGPAIAYLLAGPIFNPIVGFSTWIAYSYDTVIVFTRLFSGVVIAVFIGYLTNILFRNKSILTSDKQKKHSCPHTYHHHHSHDHHHDGRQPTITEKFKEALIAANEDFFNVGKYLVIGAFIAALSQSFIAREGIVAWMTHPLISIFLMMVMALLLNLCSESDAFIAAAFRGTSIPLSAQMAFMILGPMLDLKLIVMYLGVFRTRFILFLVPLVFISVFFVVCLLHYVGGIS